MKAPFRKLFAILAALLGLGWIGFAQTPNTNINPALIYWQAIGVTPQIAAEDHDYLFTNEWAGRGLDERAKSLAASYRPAMKLIIRAAKSHAPCDWGDDWSAGPEMLLPHLSKLKGLVYAARLQVHMQLQDNDQDSARELLLAGFVLARNTAEDRIVISSLVQTAMQNIMCSAIAEQFGKFDPLQLQRLGEALDRLPQAIEAADCMQVERKAFPEWFVHTIKEIREKSGTEGEAVEKIRELLANITAKESGGDAASVDKIMQGAGGSVSGLLQRVQELGPLYDEQERMLRLPYAKFAAEEADYTNKLKQNANPLAAEYLIGNLKGVRGKQFWAEVKLVMVRAAIAWKTSGAQGFERIVDPASGKPFALERFVSGGVDRGFRIKSKLNWRGFEETFVFIEKDGPAIYLDGEKAGQKLN